MKKCLATFLVLIALATTGCGTTATGTAPTPEKLKDNLRVLTVTLNDDNVVECVVFQSVQEGGLWCIESEAE